MARAASALLALLLTVSLAAPHELANPIAVHPLQSAGSTIPSAISCMGYNGVNDSYIPRIVSGLRVALIQPILTSTPYSQYNGGSFYAFYKREAGVNANVTTNLNLLSTNVSTGYGSNKGWGLSYGTYLFFNSTLAESCGLKLGRNVQILTDMDVADGALFDPQNHTSRFDVVVLPFSEYVEASEYLAYEHFVAGGGTLVMMAHSLEYAVTYNATTNFETLVLGHGWAFNGRYAYPTSCGRGIDASCPWAKNSTDWVGSNSCLNCARAFKYNGSVVNPRDPMGKAIFTEFGSTVFSSYVSHEEDVVTNMSGTSIVAVIANYSTHLVASYSHHFRKGVVVNFGLFGDDIIQKDPSAQYFMLLGAVLGRSVPTSTVANSTASLASSSTTLNGTDATLSSSTTALTSSASALASPTTLGSTLEQTNSSAAVSRSPVSPPSVLVALGVMVAVVITAGALVLRRREASPGG